MRGIYTPITGLRRNVFKEVAQLAYSGDFDNVNLLPYNIIKGEVALYRDSVFKERAIVAERIRLACGLNLRRADEHAPISTDFYKAISTDRVYEAPLINVIPFACNACEETSYFVTNNCRNCLAHPCTSVCPVKAVSMTGKASIIDKTKCIKCGRCQEACPYNAIIHYDRPCAAACGVDAIESDNLGRAIINQEKCVACGQCLVSCPFSAIADKSQIFQLVLALKSNVNIIAEIAPAFVGQFGPLATPDKVKAALLELGFSDVIEVAVGADIACHMEAEHFVEKVVRGEQKLLATSCCPSWSVMAKTLFPELIDCISTEFTPMVATARVIKEQNPTAKVAFIGPCAAKKLEAFRWVKSENEIDNNNDNNNGEQVKKVGSDIDFAITFEELMGIFAAKNIEFTNSETMEDATSLGRGYGVAGGVADAIVNCIHSMYDDIDVPIERAEGLANCRKMLTLAKASKYDGFLLEGMACEGGCIGGSGTLQPIKKAAASVNKFANERKAK